MVVIGCVGVAGRLLLGATGSADQRISGGWCSHGGAEARREQREESTTVLASRGAAAWAVVDPVPLDSVAV
jgi:hypothetical protein